MSRERIVPIRRVKPAAAFWASIVFSIAVAFRAEGQTPLTAIDVPEGGKVVYGRVDGAKSPAEAMSSILRVVHSNCREKPQVGKVFKVRGTESVAVFFTVVNHPQGNKQVAGMLIASASKDGGMEAALVSDDAARFGNSVNPMLRRLFAEWHPGGPAPVSAPAAGGKGAPPAALHRVMTPDGSASVAIPDGWNFQGQGGTALVVGPHYETVSLNLTRGGTNPGYGNPAANNGKIDLSVERGSGEGLPGPLPGVLAGQWCKERGAPHRPE